MATTTSRPTFDELLELVERLADGYIAGDVPKNDLTTAINVAFDRSREYDARIKAVIARVLAAKDL